MQQSYNDFIEKFKPKLTTDDCYTPEAIYQTVADWVAAEYRLDKSNFVRPFWPGEDYKKTDYKESDIVVDNPPFSILAEIRRYYCDHNIKYFLFAPALTIFNRIDDCAVCASCEIVYQNGAKVNTSFVTNLDTENRIRSAPTLYEAVKETAKRNSQTRKLPRYSYPPQCSDCNRCELHDGARSELCSKEKRGFFHPRPGRSEAEEKKHIRSGLFNLSEMRRRTDACWRAGPERHRPDRVEIIRKGVKNHK